MLISGGVFSTVVDLLPDRNSFTIIAKNGPKAAAATVSAYYLPGSQVSLQSVALSPDPLAISLGKGKQVTAIGAYSNGQTVDLTRTCNWTSSDEGVAVVRAGYVQSKRYGRTIVTAQCGPFVNEVRVAVNEADIVELLVSYERTNAKGETVYAFDAPRLNPGDKINFRAVGYYANDEIANLTAIATWSSSNPAIAAPDARGSATALALGSSTITATYNDVSGSNTLTVVPPVITLIITSPGEYGTTDKDRITVKGAVFSKATEVGVRVNGIPATVSGNQFVANRVPVPEGSSMITVEASDTNGSTAYAEMIVRREASGNPLRLAASIESGIGPLETVLRIDGVPADAVPDIKASGPGAVEFVDCSSTDSCKIRMVAVGVYTITVTSVGYDSNTYSDSISLTVLDRVKLDALLQAKWAGMKAKLAKGDVEGAIQYFSEGSKPAFRSEFNRLSPGLPELVARMGLFRLVNIYEGYAEYDLRTVKDGVTYSFQVLFMRNADGTWKIRSF